MDTKPPRAVVPKLWVVDLKLPIILPLFPFLVPTSTTATVLTCSNILPTKSWSYLPNQSWGLQFESCNPYNSSMNHIWKKLHLLEKKPASQMLSHLLMPPLTPSQHRDSICNFHWHFKNQLLVGSDPTAHIYQLLPLCTQNTPSLQLTLQYSYICDNPACC